MCDVACTETETGWEREIQRGGGKGVMGLNCLVVQLAWCTVGEVELESEGKKEKTARERKKMLGCRMRGASGR
jgi:hypothetical protein